MLRAVGTTKRLKISLAVFFPEVAVMTIGELAESLSRLCGWGMSGEFLVSFSSAFAIDQPEGVCWRAFQEMVAGERPGMPPDFIANSLNRWRNAGSNWIPVAYNLTDEDLQAFARAFATDKECWNAFRSMVESSIATWKPVLRAMAEQN
jgi:hypothetical protein